MNFKDVKDFFTNLTWQASIVMVVCIILIFFYIYTRYRTYKNWRDYVTDVPKSIWTSCPDQWTKQNDNVCMNTYKIGNHTSKELVDDPSPDSHIEDCEWSVKNNIPWEKCGYTEELDD